MSDTPLIDAVRSGDGEEIERRLDAGADVHERDEQDWTPLNWAAGRGDADAVRRLLERGADVTLTGRDLRTPLAIAKAAGHAEAAELLTAAEREAGVWEDPAETRPYCRAYYVEELRRHPAFAAGEASAPAAEESAESVEDAPAGEAGEEGEEEVVFLHQDFTVTRSMWHGEDVVFADVDEEWRAFCRERLEFAIPADLL